MTELIGALVAAGAAVVVGILNLVATRSVRHHINSRMDELIRLTRKDAHAEGVKEGRGDPH